MELSYLFPQDTIRKDSILLPYVPVAISPGELRIDQTRPVVKDIGQKDTVTITVANSTVKTEKPTLAQIRYWQRQRENKLLVNGKRYMEPKTGVHLVSTAIAPKEGVGLPNRKRNIYNTDWLTLVLVVALVLFAVVKFSFSKYLNHLFQAVVNYATSLRMFEERSYSISNGAICLEIFFYLTLSVFLFQVANHFNLEFPFQNRMLYLLTFGGVVIYFVLKKLAYRAIGTVIEGREETGEYLFNHDNFNRVAGLVLFPIVTLVAFSPFKKADFMILTGAVVLAVFYFLLLGRGVSILLKKQFSIFYLFLYLCSLEFLPLLLIYKVVV
jgi:hypothetical protein